jgi:hypothetical protein
MANPDEHRELVRTRRGFKLAVSLKRRSVLSLIPEVSLRTKEIIETHGKCYWF